jgi:threonine dehydrogenase-like Zn-dependent dehydrogenase
MLFAWFASLTPFARRALIVGGAALALLTAAGLWLHFHDRGVIRDHEAEREAAAGEARETAANERVADAAANARTEQEMHDAIDDAPKGGGLSPAAHALACERLRKRGRVPAGCGPAGGDGSQAGAD